MAMLWPSLSLPMKGLLGRRPGDDVAFRAESLAREALSLPTLREAGPQLQIELSRARRYERPFSLALLSRVNGVEDDPSPNGAGRDPHVPERGILLEARTPQLASLLVARILTDLLRPSDRVVYVPAHDWFVIALPEADRDQACQAIDRIEPVIRARVHVGLAAGIATFPDDGLTLAELMSSAEDRWRLQLLRIGETGPTGVAAEADEEDR